MLYKKNNTKELDFELFKNPTSEYRGTPFWSWNCKLDKETLLEQIGYLKEMGFGGFHMHSRSGMATEYLSEDFFDLVKTCVDKAKSEDMLAWLYDEDRWSSGSAGGYVTKIKKFRKRFLLFTPEKQEDVLEKEQAIELGKTYLFACYDIELDDNGKLVKSRVIDETEIANGAKWYAYVCCDRESGWTNNQTYVDTLSKEAIDKFIQITHEAYKKHVGDEFGKTIPAIFTDEPNCDSFSPFKFAKSNKPATIAWTADMDSVYEDRYGIRLKENLPEIFWDSASGKPSRVRYLFFDCMNELFSSAFMDNCANWCEENNIHLTGHVLLEETLDGQARCMGEAMRCYRSMGIPGIDMLSNKVELTTAKQTQSMVHQCGREAMMSELYGVTNWDFDFRGHKFQGDWQAAFGVTVRVPHLSWVSMKGSAKRDYPASINYQSPWFKEYPYIEDHFARLNTVMSRGKPAASVGVIHPIESYWLNAGPADANSDKLKMLDEDFETLTSKLAFGLIDFDFIAESMLPSMSNGAGKVLNVGEMNYSTVIVPGCDTIRRTTFELLKKFRENGGNLIFCGGCPKCIDAIETNEVKELYDISKKTELSTLVSILESEQFINIKRPDGTSTDNLIHSVRNDNGVLWVFAAHAKKVGCIAVPTREDLKIIIKGEFIPSIYDTVNGEIIEPDYQYENGNTVITRTIYDSDSLLIRLEKGCGSGKESIPDKKKVIGKFDFKDAVGFSREEVNVYMLDIAEYKLDDGEFNPPEEILRLDLKCREKLGFPKADGCDIQPWAIPEETISHYVTLKYDIDSEFDTDEVWLGAEEAESVELNGEKQDLTPCGYFVDKSIKKIKLTGIKKGRNTLVIKTPIGKRLSVECYYLLGNFNVSVAGSYKKILPAEDKIHFGNMAAQGLPFYGGNVTYKTEINVPDDCSLDIFSGRYNGALVKVKFDGKDLGRIVYPPYMLTVENVAKGTHTIEFTVFGTRVNTFASMHNYNESALKASWYGPDYWYYADGNGWSYEYVLKETGMLSSPRIIFKK